MVEGLPVLSLLILLPFIGALMVFLLPERRAGAARWIALVFSLLPLLLSLYLYWLFWSVQPATTGYLTSDNLQFVEDHSWVPSLGISYSLGVDGISLPLVFLTALLSCLAIV